MLYSYNAKTNLKLNPIQSNVFISFIVSALWRTDTGQPTIGGGRNCINYLPDAPGLSTSTCGDYYTLSLCEGKYFKGATQMDFVPYATDWINDCSKPDDCIKLIILP